MGNFCSKLDHSIIKPGLMRTYMRWIPSRPSSGRTLQRVLPTRRAGSCLAGRPGLCQSWFSGGIEPNRRGSRLEHRLARSVRFLDFCELGFCCPRFDVGTSFRVKSMRKTRSAPVRTVFPCRVAAGAGKRLRASFPSVFPAPTFSRRRVRSCFRRLGAREPLGEADDAGRLDEAGAQMEGQAFVVAEFAIACELGATAFCCPLLACGQQRAPASTSTTRFVDVDALEVAEGACARTLHAIATQLALGESDRRAFIVEQQEDGCVAVRDLLGELRLQILGRMRRP